MTLSTGVPTFEKYERSRPFPPGSKVVIMWDEDQAEDKAEKNPHQPGHSTDLLGNCLRARTDSSATAIGLERKGLAFRRCLGSECWGNES